MTDDTISVEPTYFDKAQRYRIISMLGAGNFGIVYRAFDEKWQEEVALKTSRDDSTEQQQWLKEEYRIQSDIVHPILVQPDELRKEEERYFFTMKLVENPKSFTDYFADRRPEKEAEKPAFYAEICAAAAELADGLLTIHSFDRCHGDIKPDNVLVSEDGRVALLDFGFMRSANSIGFEHYDKASLIGTPTYLAPEQYSGSLVSVASDWYALALMLHETITGRAPFSADPLEALIAKQMAAPKILEAEPTLPRDLASLIDSMLDPDPSMRPMASEVARQLHASADGYHLFSNAWQSNEAFLDDRFFAREQELGLMREALSKVHRRQPQIVEISGPSGIGKSSLVRYFLETELDNANSLVLEGRCLPNEAIPYKAFDAVVGGLANFLLASKEQELSNWIPQSGAAPLGLLFPELRRVKPIEERSNNANIGGDPRTLRQAGFRGLGELFKNIGKSIPLVIWVDDVQWADADSAALLESVFAEFKDTAVLLILSRRPEEEFADNDFLPTINKIPAQQQTKLALEPMDHEHSLALVEAILSSNALTANAIEQIVEQSGGLPYLLSELAHYAREKGGNFSVHDDLSNSQSLLADRLGTLAREDSVLVELAAVATIPLTTELLLAAADSVQRYRIRDLCILRLLKSVARNNEQAIQIYHDHLREFVVKKMSPETAIKRHASLLFSMESAGDFDPETILPHAIAINDNARTRRHALAAAERAADALAFEQAADFYEIAIDTYNDSEIEVTTLIKYADALANAGQSTRAAPTYEKALKLLLAGEPSSTKLIDTARRRAGEQYLKSGHFTEGKRLLKEFLHDMRVELPGSGRAALFVSSLRRARLYFRGFKYQEPEPPQNEEKVARLEHLWAATTALSMMDPVSADSVGLLHFLESLKCANKAHIARSLGYEAAFAALIGGVRLRAKSNDLLALNSRILEDIKSPYEQAFYHLGLGTASFFNSDWSTTVRHCDLAANKFREECFGAEYEASVAVVFALQAMGLSGNIKALSQRLPSAIKDAEERGDLFAANNCRGGFHAIGRIATGQLEVVQADLQKVVETWTPGFYQMHAYHRVFAGVNADLYLDKPHSALARIDDDWKELRSGLFLTMELPATELRFARARACLAVAAVASQEQRRSLTKRAKKLVRLIRRSTIAAAEAHVAILNAGLAALEGDKSGTIKNLRTASSGYRNARMQINHEVAKWTLGVLLDDEEGELLRAQAATWQADNDVVDMPALAAVFAPACNTVKQLNRA